MWTVKQLTAKDKEQVMERIEELLISADAECEQNTKLRSFYFVSTFLAIFCKEMDNRLTVLEKLVDKTIAQ